MKRKIGDYIINTDLITHIYKEEQTEPIYYNSTSALQLGKTPSYTLGEPETIYICFGECFLRFYKGYGGYDDALNLYNEFENEAKLQST